MGGIVGLLLVLIAAGTMIIMMIIVMREKHEPEEHYIPPARPQSTRAPGAMSETDKAEIVGTEMTNPSPVADRAEEQRAQE